MPKLSKSLPKYQKHRASGQAVVKLYGRCHYLGPHGTAASKREYDRLVAEWLSSGRSTSYGANPERYAVVELVVDFLTHAKAYYGCGPRGTYATMVRACRPLKQLYSRLAVEEFGVQQFKAIRQQLVDANLSRSYINETMRRVVAVFRWGAGEGLIPASVVQTLDVIPGLRKGRSGVRETDPVKPVDAAIVEATLSQLPTIVADMVRFQQLTGARPGDVCGLRPCDVDRTTGGEVWLNSTVMGGGHAPIKRLFRTDSPVTHFFRPPKKSSPRHEREPQCFAGIPKARFRNDHLAVERFRELMVECEAIRRAKV